MGTRKGLAFLSCLVTVPLSVKMLDGVTATPLRAAVLAGALLGVAYLLIRPVLRLLTFPVGCLTLGLSGFLIDCALIMALPRFVPGFAVAGFEWAALCALLVNGVCLIAGGTR
ncbi:MAG: phage holin family protein [Clostridia bacterium]